MEKIDNPCDFCKSELCNGCDNHNKFQSDNPFCSSCKEKDCLIELEGTCEMVRKYLQYVKEHQNENT